jgi:hypothetical protein
MSTTIKRVALVAVAALSLGFVSAPSQAASQADALTLSSATASQLTYETQTAGSAVATLSFLGANVGDTMSVSAFLVSAPAGNTVSPQLVVSDTSNALSSSTAKDVVGKDAGTKLGQVAYVSAAGSTVAASAKFIVYMDGPTVAGTYVVKLTPAVVSGGGVLNATSQTLTITVATNPAKDTVAASATVVLNKGETNSATTDDVVTFPKGTSAEVAVTARAAAATLSVKLLNAAGVAAAESFTATVAGPGILGSATAAANSATVDAANPIGRAITVKNGDIVQLFNDGSSGVSTVTISSAAGLVLATKSVTFYGTATTATATVVKSIIKATSGQNAILVNLKDAAGTLITNDTTFYVSSSDATKIAGAYTSTGSISYSTTNGTLGAGYLIPVTGVAAGTASITVGTKSSATATTGVDAAAVSVRVGSATPASVSVTTDKSSYAPGEKATITVVLKDSTGLELADSVQYASIFATGGITASYTLGAGSDTTTATAVDAFTSGKKTFTVYMPVTEGDVKFSWTTGTGLATANQGVDGSVTVGVSSVATSAAIDAANEAAQAASDATDAALAAADAADAATTKAQEAVDAVATLSAQVSKLITALKAQITTLTNLVIKIQKKVKA